MKPKILYALFSALIIIVFISILTMKVNKETRSLSEENIPQQIVTKGRDVLGHSTRQFPSALNNKPAITIIKPSSSEKPTLAAGKTEGKIKESREPERISFSSNRDSAISEEEPAGPGSDITKIGKNPTEEEKKEMNTRGIVMY